LNNRRLKKDYYQKLAKSEGYRSRAAWKLKQLNKRFGIFNDAKVVIDLGASPGGWLQVESELVKEDGFVLGVDLQRIESLQRSNVKTIQGDVKKPSTLVSIKTSLPGPVDVVVSDISPNVSGIWELDHARQIDLARTSLEISKKVLKQGGNIVIKAFQGSMFNDFLNEVKNSFQNVKVTKPPASRKESAEMYIVARKFKKGKKTEINFKDD
jgi:23S rRNA (uridine2552-2'-O)-methyltransferase